MNETKPGYKTTEFWLSLLATLLGFLLASGVMDTVPADSWIAKLIGGLVAVLATLGYSASRAKVKSALPTGQAGSTGAEQVES
jgi:hypothetical protein